LNTYHPSVDWGNELVHSAMWILTAWAISAVCVYTVGVVLIRHTVWARQFWRITGDYFTGPDAVPVWSVLGVLLLSVITAVRLEVLVSYYNNDLYSALQTAFQGAGAHDAAQRNSGVDGFWFAIVMFCIIAAIRVTRIVFDTYLTQRFIVSWRMWLTDRLTTDWLGGHAYYRGRFAQSPVDNPDQRIQQDIDIFTAGVGTGPNEPTYYSQSILLFGAVDAIVSVASFTVILWKLSGPLAVFGFEIPKVLFWAVLAYVTVASVVAFSIGRPLIKLSYHNERTNAAFRYALVRLRDAAEATSLYRGARAEREQLDYRFAAVIANYRRYLRRTIGLVGWNYTATVAIVPLPFVLQAPRLFAGTIKLGDVMQSATAFGKIQSGLSFFRNAYSQFACYNAAILRLHGLLDANQKARELPTLVTQPSPDDAIELHNVAVRTPTGKVLIDALDLRLEPGDSLLITGPSGSGKTTLLRSLAELWPAATGHWCRPRGRHTLFLPQMPYIPLGDLRAAIGYPTAARCTDDNRLRHILTQVSLPHLGERLDAIEDWATVLSPGEQQRIAFARILLARPKVVFLDEATSALDEGLELALYLLLRTELPDAITISISHHHTLGEHHQRRLHLDGNGSWQHHAPHVMNH
jgi:putative ATP-binding cassette transporter